MSGDEPDRGHFEAAYGLKSGEETRAHYRSWAESYDREVGEENGYAQPQRVAKLLSRLHDARSIEILDAGCGSGLSGVALKSAGFSRIDGCDFSPEMLAKAKEKNVYRNLWEADLNAGQSCIADAVYDAVTIVGVFSFGHVIPHACDDLIRLLKPGGHLIIALNDPFWQRGDLAAKLDELESKGTVRILAKEFGDHLPGHGVMGWVIALKKQ